MSCISIHLTLLHFPTFWTLEFDVIEILSAVHIWVLIFLPILLGEIAQTLSDWMEAIGEQQLSSLAKDFQIEVCVLCHSNTSIYLVLNHCHVAVYLGSWACWKVTLSASLKSLADFTDFLLGFPCIWLHPSNRLKGIPTT